MKGSIMYFRYTALLSLLLAFSSMQAKVLMITHSYNRPDFIEVQCKTFKKFLKDEYEFVVFNDAKDRTLANQIKQTCEKLELRCIRIPQEIHDRPYLKRLPGEQKHAPAVRNCNVVMYSLDQLGFEHDGIVGIIDSDMFLVRDFSVESFMRNYDIAGIPQHNGHRKYVWIGLAFMDMSSMPDKRAINFNCGKIDGVAVDAGGYTAHYINSHPDLRINFFSGFHAGSIKTDDHAWLEQHIEDQKMISFLLNQPSNIELFLDQCFLHYRSGTNWDHKSPNYHARKTALLNEFINNLVSN